MRMREFLESPDFVFLVLIFGLLLVIPFGYLGYTAAKQGGMDPAAVMLSTIGGVVLAFVATALLVLSIWAVCQLRSCAVEEIRQFLPNYIPVSFKERVFRYFDFRNLGEVHKRWLN